jgi:hypothetical protein
MLHELDVEGKSWIVSWLPDGKSFRIYVPSKFAELVIPKYFRDAKYKSFQRKLYLYGFRSLDGDTSMGK